MIQLINVLRLSLECTEYSHLHYQKRMYVDLRVYFNNLDSPVHQYHQHSLGQNHR